MPRSTLKDRTSGRVIHGKNPGPVRYLSSDEEILLADYLLKSSDMGRLFHILFKIQNGRSDTNR